MGETTQLGENYREYRTFDKSTWARGDWDHEPDKAQWIDTETGLDCLIVRNHFGALCGYVGVPLGHKHHSQNYNDIDAECHGGLTFSSACSHGAEDKEVCHIAADGRPDSVWWFGFDCAHGGDLCPAMEARYGHQFTNSYDSYKSWRYVVRQVRELAGQLAERSK